MTATAALQLPCHGAHAAPAQNVCDDAAMVADLEQAFHRAMVKIYEAAKRDAGYNATRFLQMIADSGGLGAARQLLHGSSVSEGFTALWLAKRLDLSVEAHVLKPEFAPLFREAERDIARRRLSEHGYPTERT